MHGDAYLIQAFTDISASKVLNNTDFIAYVNDALTFYTDIIIHERYGTFRTFNSFREASDNGYAIKGSYFSGTAKSLQRKLISNETLASIVDKYELFSDYDTHIIYNKNDQALISAKANLFHAIIGAYFVAFDGKYEILKSVVQRVLPFNPVFKMYEERSQLDLPFIPDLSKAVTQLKEFHEMGGRNEPFYEFDSFKVSDKQLWSCLCTVQSMGSRISLLSTSKKTGKAIAAYYTLCKFFEVEPELVNKIWKWHDLLDIRDGEIQFLKGEDLIKMQL